MTGRLQLPLTATGELEELSNVVRVRCEYDQDLKAPNFTAIELFKSESEKDKEVDNEWPLALQSSAAAEAPRILWKEIKLNH